MSACFNYIQGNTPLLINIPHSGLHIPDDIKGSFLPQSFDLSDTDWHVDRLYQFTTTMGASVLKANYSRYVIDLNRPPDNSPLYTTATTGLCPEIDFNGDPLYRKSAEPDAAEINRRVKHYWAPYHQKLQQELALLIKKFGFAILYDAHSIRSQVPMLFEGKLADFNIGTHSSQSCDNVLEAGFVKLCSESSSYNTVSNGRFKGGYITRQYGDPVNNVHALQMELAQINYMNEYKPFEYREDLAQKLQVSLKALINYLIHWVPFNDS